MKARCMLLMALVAASAAARPQPARSVSRPSWAALPISAMPELPAPSAAPSSVSADEHVAGFEIEPARSLSPAAHSRSGLSKQSRTANEVVEIMFDPGPADACVVPREGLEFLGQPRSSGPFRVTRSNGTLSMSPGVHPIRTERVVQSAGRAYLEIVDIWLDAQTLGSRLEARHRVPLELIAQGPLRIKVFGFRDPRAAWMIVSIPERANLFRERSTTLSACRHARSRLELGPKGAAIQWLVAVSAGDAVPTTGSRESVAFDGFRAFAIAAGLSRLSRDPMPVLSVAITPAPREVRRALASLVVNSARQSRLGAL